MAEATTSTAAVVTTIAHQAVGITTATVGTITTPDTKVAMITLNHGVVTVNQNPILLQSVYIKIISTPHLT